MSWRSSSQRTGMNAQPLGGARRWGGGNGDANDGGGGPYPPSFAANSYMPSTYSAAGTAGGSGQSPRDAAMAAAAAVAASIGVKRDREPSSANGTSSYSPSALNSTTGPADLAAPRKRKSRWGDAADQINIPTAIGSNVSAEELDKYAIQVRLDEIARKLRSGDFIPPDRERSPSPPPTYDPSGRRTNTREVRYRKKLEDERISLIDRQLKLDPNYRPPAEYHATKRNQRPTEKVFLPIKDFPEINFFGLLVGPRGNTLKTMERQSGAKISIRGKGSVKDGKGKGGDEDEEEMHCVVTADDEAAVKKCIKLINQVIETAASTPEGENDHKRNQLRELAALNGTLRDDENQVCKNCGNKGHRAFECPEQRNWTAHIICHRCGGQGHLARDCTQGRVGAGGALDVPAASTGNRHFDSEYANLMAELGEGSPAGASGATGGGAASVPSAGAANGAVGADGKKIPPWRNPGIWQQPVVSGPRGGAGGPGGPGGDGRGGWVQRGYGANPPQYGHPPHQQQPAHYPQDGYASGAQYDQHSRQTYAAHPGAYSGADRSNMAASGGAPDAAAAPSTDASQQDYSAEWAAYYAAQAAANGAQPADGAHAQAEYTKEWEEYYRMQAAAAAQDGSAAYPQPQ